MAAEGDKQPDAHQHTLRISSRFGRQNLAILKKNWKKFCSLKQKLKTCVIFPEKYNSKQNSDMHEVKSMWLGPTIPFSSVTHRSHTPSFSISVWQQVKLCEEIYPWHTLVVGGS